ncbi:MAG: ParB/RepB/Spo0J family partition protein [Deltaproteobacteria bacterium]|nr:ParB/RepB/Spo0J family partition protein [Deltaproteobacteria bacterium]
MRETTKALEIVDGFKRLEAARALKWTRLDMIVRPFDQVGKWAAMVHLNQGPQSMTIFEEAMVLREIARLGLNQTQIGELLDRHKTWVSRRIGLVEELHPELIETMKLGLLHPGTARRLLVLPPRNQLEMAAAIQKHGLGAKETELLVSLWKKLEDPTQRQTLLFNPKEALRGLKTKSLPIDPRLSPTGQKVQRSLRCLTSEASRIAGLLKALERPEDSRLLEKDLRASQRAVQKVSNALGALVSALSVDESIASGETSESSGSTGKERKGQKDNHYNTAIVPARPRKPRDNPKWRSPCKCVSDGFSRDSEMSGTTRCIPSIYGFGS